MSKLIEKFGVTKVVIVGVVGALVVLSSLFAIFESDESKQAKAEATAVAQAEKDAAEAEKRKAGFHCVGLNREIDAFNDVVKSQLKDPGSLRVEDTRIASVDGNGKHAVFMDYTATNSFGARVRGAAAGEMDTETCQVTLLAQE